MTGFLFIQQLTFTAFVLFTFFAVIQLSLRNKLPLNYYLAGLFFTGGYILLYYWMYSMNIIRHIPVLFSTETVATFMIGPFFYLYFCAAFGATDRPKRRILLHFILPAVVAAESIWINLSEKELILHYIVSNPDIPNYFTFGPFYVMLYHLSDLSMGIYFLFTLIRTSILFRKEKYGREVRIIRIFLLMITISGMFLVTAGFFSFPLLYAASLVSFSILPLYYMFFAFRNPGLSLKVLKEARTIRYEKSIVRNLNLDLVLARLSELMDSEQLYRKENLNLNSLAENLKITPHQLSSILNEKLNRNFRSYVNEYRIREAEQLLIEKPETGVLEISMTVGFNSKSAFYSAFQKETGCLPAEFRKKHNSL